MSRKLKCILYQKNFPHINVPIVFIGTKYICDRHSHKVTYDHTVYHLALYSSATLSVGICFMGLASIIH